MQRLRRLLRRSKVKLRDQTDRLPVEFLRIRRIHLIGSKSRLHMTDRNLLIECGEPRGKGRCGISVHQYDIRLFYPENFAHSHKNCCCYIGQILSLLHNIQVVIRNDAEDIKHLLQHFPVLAGDTDDRLQLPTFPKLQDKRTHLNRFRSCSEYHHYLSHSESPPSSASRNFSRSRIVFFSCSFASS